MFGGNETTLPKECPLFEASSVLKKADIPQIILSFGRSVKMINEVANEMGVSWNVLER